MATSEMTFFESFRFIDTYTEAVLKLREAAHTIEKHGADLNKWEAEGREAKDRIKAEIDTLTRALHKEQTRGDEQRATIQAEGLEAAQLIQPTLNRVAEAQEALTRVSNELNRAREDKASLIEEAKVEADQIVKDATDEESLIANEIESKVALAKRKCEAYEARVSELKEDINEL